MKIYTRTGDAGETALFGGPRTSKADARVCAYGAVDEANAAIGMCAAATSLPDDVRTALMRVMNELFDVGAELATPAADEAALAAKLGALCDDGVVVSLERAIDAAELELAPLRSFILPSGTDAAARLHFARTVVRRSEREVVALASTSFVRPVVLRYLNRLSDALFVWARLANARAGVSDVAWQKRP